MLSSYLKLGVAALMPVAATCVFYIWEKKKSFTAFPYWLQQLFIGILFGGLACIGTEWGIPMNGATVNCRDAAPLCAGLFFGGPAGIIAGVIGGVERWFAVYWGAGSFTRVACSVSTIIAGVYAALLRKFMFEGKKPSWTLSLVIGVVMEVFHLTMVFLTNLGDAVRAAAVVKACSIPMISFSGLSVVLAAICLTVLSKERLLQKRENVGISQFIQRWLLICVFVTFLLSSALVFVLQNNMAAVNAESLLRLSITDVDSAVEEAASDNIMKITRQIAAEYKDSTLEELAESYGVAEISIIDRNGIIVESTGSEYIGYDIHDGEQSSEFLAMLDGKVSEYVQSYGTISSDASIERKYAAVLSNTRLFQVGFDAEQFQENIASEMETVTHNRHVGESGFLIVTDAHGSVVSSGADLETLEEIQYPADVEENTVFDLTVGDTAYYGMYSMAEGYTLLSLMPVGEALESRNIVLYVNTFMEILSFAVLFAMIYLLIKKIVVNNIRNVNNSLAEITNGNLTVTVNVRNSEEFSSLSDDINSTVSTLRHYIDEAAARIDRELEFARSIQTSSLPSTFPAFPNRKDFDIYAFMDTAKEVGGDFYDFYMPQEHKVYFIIADVSGKGIPAALFMMRAKTQLKSLAENGLPLDEVFRNGNDHLCDGNDAGMFVTAWMGMLDLSTGILQYVNGGHNHPLLRHSDGKFEYLRSRPGFVLAGMEGYPYRKQELQLAAGDTLFLYTDGVTEATDANKELYGDDRLESFLNTCEYVDMNDLCHKVKADVDAFVGDAPQFDDITMVALKYFGRVQYPEIHFDEAAISDIPAVTEFVEQELEKLNCPMKITTRMSIAIDEIYSNIVKFAYGGKAGSCTVHIIPSDSPKGVTLGFTDSGTPYNPLIQDDPDVTLSAEERSIGGLGIFMVKNFMDDITYEYRNGRNILRLYKKFE